MSPDLDAIRQRHLRKEQMEHRTFYEGHIVIDLAALIEEVERLREGEARRLQLLDDAGGLENERNALAAGREHYRRAMEYADAEAERLREENRKLREVLEWVNNQCPGKCAGVCDAALRVEEEP